MWCRGSTWDLHLLLAVVSQLLLMPGLSPLFSPFASSLLFFFQGILCDLTKGIKATDGRLLLWLPRGELGSAGEDVGLESCFSLHTMWTGLLGLITGNDGRQDGMGRGSVKKSCSVHWLDLEST